MNITINSVSQTLNIDGRIYKRFLPQNEIEVVKAAESIAITYKSESLPYPAIVLSQLIIRHFPTESILSQEESADKAIRELQLRSQFAIRRYERETVSVAAYRGIFPRLKLIVRENPYRLKPVETARIALILGQCLDMAAGGNYISEDASDIGNGRGYILSVSQGNGIYLPQLIYELGALLGGYSYPDYNKFVPKNTYLPIGSCNLSIERLLSLAS